MSSTVRLGFVGDVMLGRLVDRRQRSRSIETVWGDLLDRLQSLDGLFINLECCLSARGHPWSRTYRPFHFRADPDWAVPALKRAGVDWVSLANNHVLDYEEVALNDTLVHLDTAGIAHAGAGKTVDDAREPAHVSIEGLDIVFVSFTDNTPEYAAGSDSPGVARVEFDIADEETKQILEETLAAAWKMNPDLLVASLHWGPNMVTEPSDAFQDTGHWLVEQGVDIVYGHSAHVFQGVEIYTNSPILYDTGDFVDDYAVDDELRNDRGFLFELRVDQDGTPRDLRLFPTEIHDCAVHESNTSAADWSRDRMRELSEPFGTKFEQRGDSYLSVDF